MLFGAVRMECTLCAALTPLMGSGPCIALERSSKQFYFSSRLRLWRLYGAHHHHQPHIFIFVRPNMCNFMRARPGTYIASCIWLLGIGAYICLRQDICWPQSTYANIIYLWARPCLAKCIIISDTRRTICVLIVSIYYISLEEITLLSQTQVKWIIRNIEKARNEWIQEKVCKQLWKRVETVH